MDEIIAKIEAEGFYWAVCREANGSYTAYVAERSYYIGDDLSGPCAVDGTTAIAALTAAFDEELGHKRARQQHGRET